MTRLAVEGLAVHYGAIRALHDVSFTVEEGEMVALIGANGAGKSTALWTLAGQIGELGGRVVAGRVRYGDADLLAHSAAQIVRRFGLALVPEGRRIFGNLTVLENLRLAAYTTPDAAAVARALDRAFGERILLGMGTLTRPEQAAEALDAGARFLVSPVTDEALGRAMAATGLPIMLGALTPTEVWRAHQLGSDVVKLFPGSAVGPEYVKALRGPFPDIRLMPTGGVDEHNVGDWFRAGVFAVGAGSQLSPAKLAKEGKFDEITAVARRFAAAITAIRN